MNQIDVECPYCESAIGIECVNPAGGPLGKQGSRQQNGIHNDRYESLARTITLWESSSQGMLKATLRDTKAILVLLEAELWQARTASESGLLRRRCTSYRNRYSALWSRLQPENRPRVARYTKPEEKKDVPHPELIVCPKCGAGKNKKCDTPYGNWHIERIRKSP